MEKPCLYIIDDLGTSREVDLKLDDPITLTFWVNDLLNLSQPQSNFAKNMILLGTDKTHAVMEWAFRVDRVDRSVLHRKIKAQLVRNGVDLLKGRGVLEVADILYDPKFREVTYDCNLTSQGYNWYGLLEKLEPCDAGLGTHTFDETLVRNSWDRTGRNGTAYPYDYIGCSYFPFHYGWWLNDSEVSIHDLRPHSYVRWLLQQAFTSIGYALTGDYVSTEEFSSAVIPFGSGVFGVSDEMRDTLYKTFDVIPQIYLPDFPPTYFEATPALEGMWCVATWTQPFSYGMQINVTAPAGTLDGPGNQLPATLGLYVDDTRVAFEHLTLLPLPVINLAWSGCVEKGQKVRVKVEYHPSWPGAFGVVEALEGVQINFAPAQWSCPMGDVNLCDTLDPALDFRKILAGVVHARGLVLETDDDLKQVRMTPMEDYYKVGEQEDWTGKVDCSQTLKQSVLTDCRNFKLAFLEDRDDKALDIACTEWGAEMFSLIVNNDDTGCIREFRNPTFAPTASDGWQMYRENAGHEATVITYESTGTQYMQLLGSNTYNWTLDTWTQPYRAQMKITLIIDPGLTYDYHRWVMEVDGTDVASVEYSGAQAQLEWVGCVEAGSEVKFRIQPDALVGVVPDRLVVGLNQANAYFRERYREFNDVSDFGDTFKPVFPSIQTKRSDNFSGDLQPHAIISHKSVPRLITYKGLVEAADIGWTQGAVSWNYNDGMIDTQEDQLPYAYFHDYYQGGDTMSFSDVTTTCASPELAGSPSPVTTTGMGRRAYGLILDSLGEGVVLRMWVRLNDAEVAGLRFDIPKFIGGLGFGNGVYLLNKLVDWNCTTQMGLGEFILLRTLPTF